MIGITFVGFEESGAAKVLFDGKVITIDGVPVLMSPEQRLFLEHVSSGNALKEKDELTGDHYGHPLQVKLEAEGEVVVLKFDFQPEASEAWPVSIPIIGPNAVSFRMGLEGLETKGGGDIHYICLKTHEETVVALENRWYHHPSWPWNWGWSWNRR